MGEKVRTPPPSISPIFEGFKNMTDQQIRIAIAEACGYRWMPHRHCVHPDRLKWWIPPNDPEQTREIGSGGGAPDATIPDYPNDLNAMNGAEETCLEKGAAYASNLATLVASVGWLPETGESVFRLIRATAHQRAEALLKTLGKWNEK